MNTKILRVKKKLSKVEAANNISFVQTLFASSEFIPCNIFSQAFQVSSLFILLERPVAT